MASSSAALNRARSSLQAKFQELHKIIGHQQLALRARARVESLNLSAEDLAIKANLNPRTIQRWLGRDPIPTREPRFSTTLKIVNALGWELFVQEGPQ